MELILYNLKILKFIFSLYAFGNVLAKMPANLIIKLKKLIMKKIILSAAAAFSALALFMNNNAGAAPKTGEAYKYAANDTIPKKDTVKKDTTHTFYLQVK